MTSAAQRSAATETAPAPASRAGLPVAWVAALVVGIFLVYQPAWRAQFIWDDDAHLTAHKCIVGPLGFKEIWTTSEANYFPLVLTTFWVLNKIFGLNPVVFHLVGIALHAACAILLWAVLRRLAIRGAGLAAALWAFHPVMVESVAWVSEIINTQSCAFFLLSIWFAARWLKPDAAAPARPHDYALACLFAACAILSKPSTVMLPVILGFVCWWLRGTLRWRDAVWLAPFFAMALAASLWTIWEQKVHQNARGGEWSQTFPERLIIAGRVVWFYLGKLLWPAGLSFVYPRWTISSGNVLAYVPGVAAVGGLAWLWWRRNGPRTAAVFLGMGYFVVMLFPVLGFFNVYYFRYSFVADHFQYLASIGPLTLLAAGAVTRWQAAASSNTRAILAAACGAVVLLFAGLSWGHARNFVNDDTLWRATLQTNPDSFLAHNNLGVSLVSTGELSAAIGHYERALAVNPNLPDTHLNQANALAKMPGRLPDAIRHFEAALRGNPQSEEARLLLANSLAALPERRTDAIAHYEAVLRANPANAKAHTNLCLLLGAIPGRLVDAIAHGERAIALKPEVPEAHFNLANNLAKLPERLPRAITHYETALRLKPDYVKAHINFGLLLAQIPDRRGDAIRHYEAALALEPRSAVTHNNLAIVLAETGRLDEAQRHFEQAVQIDPNYADARNNLARLQAMRAPRPD